MIRIAIIVVLTLGAAGTVAVWAVSYHVQARDPAQIHVEYSYGRAYWFGEPTDPSTEGWFLVDVSRGTLDLNCWNYKTSRPVPASRRWRLLGFSFNVRALTGGMPPYSFWSMEIPLWCPFVLFAAYPTIAFIRGPLRRYRRRKRGLCIRCGYNLEGNVSGVCPECGEAR